MIYPPCDGSGCIIQFVTFIRGTLHWGVYKKSVAYLIWNMLQQYYAAYNKK